MSEWPDEITVVAENREPIPFEEAWGRNTDQQKFIFVLPNVELAESLFRRYRILFQPPLVRKIRNRFILLQNDAELRFLTEYEVEHGALRGLGKVVWCE